MVNMLYDNCFISTYKTFVKEVVEEQGYYWHALEETIFYVESGGMQSDEGLINQHKVLKLKKEHGKVWHLLDVKLEGKVILSIDFHLRLCRSQIHTAQHLLSGMMKSVYGANTLAHHVHDKGNDIEFDHEMLSQRQMVELQAIVNGLIRSDLPVHIFYPTALETKKYDVKKVEDIRDLRIVKIGDIMETPCGCIHVPSLRYIQMIKLTGMSKTKNGFKLHYSCGDQLLVNYDTYQDVLFKAGKLLAQPVEFVEVGILKQMQEIRSLHADVAAFRTKYVEKVIETFPKEGGLYRVFDDIDLRTFLQLCAAYKSMTTQLFIFVWKQDKRMQLYVGNKEDSDAIFQKLAKPLGIRGGGSALSAQGGGAYREDYDAVISKFLAEWQ